MIVEFNNEEKNCNLIIVDNGICQIFEDGKQNSTNINSINIKKIIIVMENDTYRRVL